MNRQLDLADSQAAQAVAPGVYWLPGAANTPALMAQVDAISAQAPFRHFDVKGGKTMSVANTNCGALGWTSSAQGYRYSAVDPMSGQPWPAMPPLFSSLATSWAAMAGFDRFEPDACLINRYTSTAQLSLHRDSDEADFSQPIVSVSMGCSAVFLLGGLRRADHVQKMPLHDGDVLVWGGPARLRFHGVRAPQATGSVAAQRFNLTFRKAG